MINMIRLLGSLSLCKKDKESSDENPLTRTFLALSNRFKISLDLVKLVDFSVLLLLLLLSLSLVVRASELEKQNFDLRNQ